MRDIRQIFRLEIWQTAHIPVSESCWGQDDAFCQKQQKWCLCDCQVWQAGVLKDFLRSWFVFCAFTDCVKSAEAFFQWSGEEPVLCLSLYERTQCCGFPEMSVRKCTPAFQTLPSDLHLVWITALVVEWEENHLGNLRLPSAKNTANAPKHRIRAGVYIYIYIDCFL